MSYINMYSKTCVNKLFRIFIAIKSDLFTVALQG